MASTASARPDGAGPHYRVVTSLGAGGTARVYLAIYERGGGFQKLVVLKTLLGHLEDEPSIVEMFRNEARIAARLEHPNVVEVHEVLEDAGRPVLVMEYLRGASLHELQRGEDAEPFALRHRLEIIERTCRGLHHCHELRDFDGTHMGLVHRDVSPHNIYVTFDGEVRLLDFGIAKIAGADGGTGTGLLKGKIRYMAPEQMMSDAVDRRADVYAIGVLLWEAVSGREMWTGMNDAVILHRTVNGELPLPEPIVADCPPELLHIMRRCLAMEPDDRYASCAEISEALEQVMRGMTNVLRPLGWFVHRRFGARDEAIAARVQTTLASPRSDAIDGELRTIDWIDEVPERRRTLSRVPAPVIPASPAPAPRRTAWIAVPIAIACAAVAWWVGSNTREPPVSVDVDVAVVASPPETAPVPAPLEPAPVRDIASEPVAIAAAATPTPVQPEPAMPRAKPKKPRVKPRAPASAIAARGECDPPHYFDAAGVKRFKRQCL
jgi:eukaryotic-like serine/threonine-protein kinase